MKDKELRKLIGSRAKQRRLELGVNQPYIAENRVPLFYCVFVIFHNAGSNPTPYAQIPHLNENLFLLHPVSSKNYFFKRAPLNLFSDCLPLTKILRMPYALFFKKKTKILWLCVSVVLSTFFSATLYGYLSNV